MLDSLQAWLVIYHYIKKITPEKQEIPSILVHALDVVDKEINKRMEGETGEVIVTSAECQDEAWDEGLNEAINELDADMARLIKDSFLDILERLDKVENLSQDTGKKFQRLHDAIMQSEIELCSYPDNIPF